LIFDVPLGPTPYKLEKDFDTPDILDDMTPEALPFELINDVRLKSYWSVSLE